MVMYERYGCTFEKHKAVMMPNGVLCGAAFPVLLLRFLL
jgi:hypothetical protein